MITKVDYQTFTSEFDSHWVAHSYGIVPHPSKQLSELLLPFLLTFTNFVDLICHKIHSNT